MGSSVVVAVVTLVTVQEGDACATCVVAAGRGGCGAGGGHKLKSEQDHHCTGVSGNSTQVVVESVKQGTKAKAQFAVPVDHPSEKVKVVVEKPGVFVVNVPGGVNGHKQVTDCFDADAATSMMLSNPCFCYMTPVAQYGKYAPVEKGAVADVFGACETTVVLKSVVEKKSLTARGMQCCYQCGHSSAKKVSDEGKSGMTSGGVAHRNGDALRAVGCNKDESNVLHSRKNRSNPMESLGDYTREQYAYNTDAVNRPSGCHLKMAAVAGMCVCCALGNQHDGPLGDPDHGEGAYTYLTRCQANVRVNNASEPPCMDKVTSMGILVKLSDKKRTLSEGDPTDSNFHAAEYTDSSKLTSGKGFHSNEGEVRVTLIVRGATSCTVVHMGQTAVTNQTSMNEKSLRHNHVRMFMLVDPEKDGDAVTLVSGDNERFSFGKLRCNSLKDAKDKDVGKVMSMVLSGLTVQLEWMLTAYENLGCVSYQGNVIWPLSRKEA